MRASQYVLAVVATVALSGATSVEGFSQEEGNPAAVCRSQLRCIYDAIQAYRRETGEFPPSLSDLYPRKIANERVLLCPVAQEKGKYNRFTEPFRSSITKDVMTAYDYEMIPVPVPAKFKLPSGTTKRDVMFKLLKSPVGTRIPLLRCRHHDGEKKWLNIDFAGNYYRSAGYWEIEFIEEFPHWYLAPHFIWKDQRPISERLVTRHLEATSKQVDLGANYNAMIGDPWVGDAFPASGLALLDVSARRGRCRIQGLYFDVRGIVQLDAKPKRQKDGKLLGFEYQAYPDAQRDIKVGAHTNELVFVHGTLFPVEESQLVAQYLVAYENSDREKEPILVRFGVETCAMQGAGYGSNQAKFQPHFFSPLSPVGDRTKKKFAVAIYRWKNPRPSEPIKSIDFVSSKTCAGPFLLAVTVQ